MAARVSASDVQQIMPEASDDNIIKEYISTANLIINTHLSSYSLGDDLLRQIEKFLTAHLLATTVYRQAEFSKVGESSKKYATLGDSLKATTYGQIVMQLDSTGVLATVGQKRAYIEAIPEYDETE